MRRRARRWTPEREGGKAVILIVTVLLVLAGGGWVAAYAGANGKLPVGTEVAGVDVGGRDRLDAAQALAHGMAARMRAPITVTVGSVTKDVTPQDAGISVDYAASVGQVLGRRSWAPGQLWHYYTGGGDVPPVVDVDVVRMGELLDGLEGEVASPAQDGGLSLSGGHIEVTEPHDGAGLVHTEAQEALVKAWTAGETAVRLPLHRIATDIDQADVDAAINEFANPALSASVTLIFAGSQVTLTPFQYAGTLEVVPRDGRLTLEVVGSDLAALVDPAAQDIPAVDADVVMQGGAPAVVPAVDGQHYRTDAVSAAFLQAVVAAGPARSVQVESETLPAAFTTRDAKHLGVVEAVGSFTVAVPSTAGPGFAEAATRLSGALLRPGDTFSFNDTVGAVSGSANRLATATWNAGFLAGLVDVERVAPAASADGLPVGRDASVAYGTTDLKLRNDSTHGVLLDVHVVPGSPGTPGSVVVDAWSTKEWEVTATTGAPYAVTPRTTVTSADPACVAQPGSDGFTIDLVRTVAQVSDAAVVRSDTVTSTYAPTDAVVCQVVPPPV